MLPEKLQEEGRCGECDCDEGLDFSFSFAFQPIIDVDNRDVYAYEALVRGTQGEGAHTILPGQALKSCRNPFSRRINSLKLVPVHCTSVLFISSYQGRCVCFIVF